MSYVLGESAVTHVMNQVRNLSTYPPIPPLLSRHRRGSVVLMRVFNAMHGSLTRRDTFDCICLRGKITESRLAEAFLSQSRRHFW